MQMLRQAILNLVLEPIKEFHKQQRDTSFLLLLHQAKITNASSTNPEIPDALNKIGAALLSSMSMIRFYRFLACIRAIGLPSKAAVLEAVQELNGIAFSMLPGERHGNSGIENSKALKKIAQLLKIQTAYR